MQALFSIAYLPPVSFFSELLRAEKILFEKHEHYVKQSYRNRAWIAGANGIHPLIIPVQHDGLYRKAVHEIKISHESPWQKIHWRTLTSAYRNSPYFEFFEDEFRNFYETRFENLFEFNLLLIQKIFSLFKIPFNPEFSSAYNANSTGGVTDLRNAFRPADRRVSVPVYHQVFADRHGFLPDLSVVDLLFNKGPDAKAYLDAL